MRLEFFDRIVLLDGGTIALSLTLVGSLSSRNPHVPLKCATVLIVAWVSFGLSMLLALLRNWIEHDRLSKAEWNNYIVALNYSMSAQIKFANAFSVAQDEAAQQQTVVDEGNNLIKQANQKHVTLLRMTQVAGGASLFMLVLGIVLLLVFGAGNILSL